MSRRFRVTRTMTMTVELSDADLASLHGEDPEHFVISYADTHELTDEWDTCDDQVEEA